MIDILYLNPGFELADADAYFSKVMPILAKYGLVQVNSYKVTDDMNSTDDKADMINIWTVSGDDTFSGFLNDPEYQKNIETRDATFNSDKTILFMMTPNN